MASQKSTRINRRRRIPVEERIWDYFDIGSTQECWEWQGNRDPRGYGRIKVNGRPASAHRLVLEITHNITLGELWALHHCDNPPCVNPNHLYPGTGKDNVRDAIERGRHPNTYLSRQGERNGQARLTAKDIPIIRQRLANGETLIGIARDFHMSWSAIQHIRNGTAWSHIKSDGSFFNGA